MPANATNATKPHLSGTLHPAPTTPDAAAASAPPAAGLPVHVFLGSLLAGLALAALVVCTIRGAWRAQPGRRAYGAITGFLFGFQFFILPTLLLETYFFRWELALAFFAVVKGIIWAWNWFNQWTPWERVALVAGALVAISEFVVVECYLFGYRYLYRTKRPDLSLRVEGSGTSRYIGRLYKVVPVTSGKSRVFELHFAKRGDGLFQWWKGLHVLHTTREPGPQVRRVRILAGGGLVQDSIDPRAWTLTDDPMTDHPLHTDSGQHVISRVLADNARASKDASEGNPFYIARRISDDPTSSASVDSWHTPEIPAPARDEEVSVAVVVGGAGAPPHPPAAGGSSSPDIAAPPLVEFTLADDEARNGNGGGHEKKPKKPAKGADS